MRNVPVLIAVLMLFRCIGHAERPETPFPDGFVIARQTFFDFGPPFNYYELIRVVSRDSHAFAERALITPSGQACFQPAKVEYSTAEVSQPVRDLLQNKNPCKIPDKEFHREQKRCKHCLVFSGVIVNMQVQCGSTERQLRMDIVDRDMFATSPRTPANTSWTMMVLAELDKVLGPGVMDKPAFAFDERQEALATQNDLIRELQEGKYDSLFGKEQEVSKIVVDAARSPSPPPSVSIESVVPVAPLVSSLPKYPPIAKAARVEGVMEITFDISSEGAIGNIAFPGPPRMKMFEQSVREALASWKFPVASWGKSGHVAIRFNLNCPVDSSRVQPVVGK